MALKTIAETATAVITASIVAAIAGYIVIDALRTGFSGTYREARLARHDALCFSLYDAETMTGNPEAEMIRQDALPRSFLGKIELFFLCSRLTELELAGAKLQHAEDARLQQIQEAQQDAAEVAAANFRSEIDGLLEDLGIDGNGTEPDPPFRPSDQPQGFQFFTPAQDTWQGSGATVEGFGQSGTNNSGTLFPAPQTGGSTGAGVVWQPGETDLQARIEQVLDQSLSATLRELDENFDPNRYSILPSSDLDALQ